MIPNSSPYSTEAFCRFLQYELNRSRHTSEAYCRDINQFIAWLCTGSAEFHPQDVTMADIRSWLGSMAKQLSPATLRRKAQSIRAYYHWLMKSGAVASNPASDIILAKIPKRLPSFVRENEMERLLDSKNTLPQIEAVGASDFNREFKQAREHIILLMLYSTGIRQEELRTLKDADINFSLREIKVLGKRLKERVIPIADALLDEIRAWKEIRDNKFKDLPVNPPFIPGNGGEAISKASLYNIVKAGLSTTSSAKKSPHVLRHTFATAMLNSGSNLDSVKEFLGHSSISTTQIYTHLSFAELKQNYTGAHPRSSTRR